MNHHLERVNYYSDSRVIESMRSRCWSILHSTDRVTAIRVTLMNDEEEEIEETYEVPTVYQVCDLCSGSGRVVDPNIDSGGLSSEDFDQDPDFKEAYFDGMYDITCPECKGNRVSLNTEAAFKHLPESVQNYIESYDAGEDEFLAERLAELRFGC